MKGNTTRNRILALILTAAMMAMCLCGCGSVMAAGSSAAAASGSDSASETSSAASSAASSAEYESVPATGDKLEKDETVYVICNPDGSVKPLVGNTPMLTPMLNKDWIPNHRPMP